MAEHAPGGNCFFRVHQCRKCTPNACDVCHLHEEARGECDRCPRCAACDREMGDEYDVSDEGTSDG